ITARGELFSEVCAAPTNNAPCIFEYVYFARPDSMIDNISVHKARMRMGLKLGEKILRLRPDHDIDTIIPIPDTSRDVALEMSNVLGVKYREGFVKNRYVGRTFIMPGQGERQKSVRRKLNPIHLEFRNRVVLLVDDSIVRGTTSRQIVQMARDAGARKVYLASAAPPVRYPNIYGIDMPAAEELIAHGRSELEIQEFLGCDWLIYQDLEDLEVAVREGNPDIKQFDSSCFNGEYITGIEPGYFERIQQLRSDDAKKRRRA
ncbi:amidophosphoribosyltransferase, partial [Xanthomonas perforans]